MTEFLTVATDGSCLKNPGGATGWAYVTETGTFTSGCQPVGTNNIAELNGLLLALRDFPTTPLIVQMDSEYALKCANVWGPSWARAGWKKRDGSTPENVRLIKAVLRRIEVRRAPIRLVKVPGHDRSNAFPLNTVVDHLAVDAARWARQHGRAQETSGSVDITRFSPR